MSLLKVRRLCAAGDYADMKTSLGSALDIALSFLGVGEYKSISYLTKASEFRKYLAGGMEAAEEVAFIAKVAKGFAAAQAVLGAAHFIFNFATNNCEIFKVKNAAEPTEGDPKYPAHNLCKKIDHWLFVVEMLTFSADFLAQRALKKATRELRAAIPDGAEYDNVRNAINNVDDLIKNLDSFILVIKQSHPNVYNKVILMTEVQKIDFMFDFSGNKVALDYLENNTKLIDNCWVKVEDDLRYLRKDIKFLTDYDKILSEHDLLKHVHEGDSILEVNINGPTKAQITGYHNANKLKDSPNSGEIGWKNPPPNYSNPNDIGNSYMRGKIKRNMNEIDPKTGQRWKIANSNPPNHFKTKRADNVFWPSNYSTDRINQEMAYVLGQLENSTILSKVMGINKKGKITIVYECKATDGHTIEIMFYGGTKDTGKLVSIYPQYF